ncbi:hypothetical protein Tco_0722831 [Tanacetum coccineum]
MSDSKDSTVTYTVISSPYEDSSDMGSPGVEGPIFQAPPSPDYVPGPKEPEQAPPSPVYLPYVPELVYLEYMPPEDDVLPAEEQPFPVASSPTTESPGYVPESDPEKDPGEDDKEDPEEDPANYPADRGDDDDDEESSDDDDDDDDDDEDEEEEEHLALVDPAAVAFPVDQDPSDEETEPFETDESAAHTQSFHQPPYYRIPSPPLPIPSLPPNSPTYIEGSLGFQAAGIRQRDALPSPVYETKIPEICLPLHATPGRWMSSELGYGIADTWDDLVGAIQEIAPTTLEGLDDARADRSILRGRVNILFRDRPYHRRTALLIEEEARVYHAAWAQSMDACDHARSEGMSLRTTIIAQQSEISELQAADRRRQETITAMLAADHRRQKQLVEALKLLKKLQTQMTEFQR